MKVVKEYLISDNTTRAQNVYMTTGADVFTATEESGVVRLFVVADNTVSTSELRSFEVHGSDELFDAECVKYIASYESSLGFRHVFEILKEGGANYEGYLH